MEIAEEDEEEVQQPAKRQSLIKEEEAKQDSGVVSTLAEQGMVVVRKELKSQGYTKGTNGEVVTPTTNSIITPVVTSPPRQCLVVHL